MCSTRGRSTVGDLLGVIDHIEDEAADVRPFDEESGEALDESILETHRNRPVDAVFGELQYREQVLGEAYPFAVDRNPLGLTRVADVTAVSGRAVYLFCLLASAIRENRIQPPDQLQAATSGIANLFQVCACLAAGGVHRGRGRVVRIPTPDRHCFPACTPGYVRAVRSWNRKTERPAGIPGSNKGRRD